MIKRTAILMTTAFMFVTLPGAAVAGDQDRDRIKDQDKLQDGSCLDYSTDISDRFNIAGDCTRDKDQDKDQLKDGSCLDYSTDMSGSFILAADQLRDRDKDQDQDKDQLKDGSCLDYSTDVSDRFTLAGDQIRDRKKDESCTLPYSTNSVNMILAGRQRDKDNIKDKLKDCKGTV